MKNKFYISTAIVYTNGPPHIGFAMELIQADVLARYHQLSGDDIFFLTGTDEHGSKIARAAKKNDLTPQKFVDGIAQQYVELTKLLNISNNDFIRTSDKKRHWPAAEKIWRKLAEKSDLYKKEYQGLYCIGHEVFIKKSELVDGMCPIHKTEPEKIKEENWFFKLTKYKKDIKKKIESGEIKIVPEMRKNEILNLLDDAEDVSFSRPLSQLKWGIPVPDDPNQTMYVWTDALVNYISALGYASDDARFSKFWPADVHLIGKDILRFHAIYWPAMLMSVGLELPKAIYVHGFINLDGEKMSKSIGNVIDPFELIKKYGADVVRYFLLREIPSGEDGNFSYEKLEERYNGDLANGLGNLVQRVVTLIDNNLDGELIFDNKNLDPGIKKTWLSLSGEVYFKKFELHRALEQIWKIIDSANEHIDEMKPWIEVKKNPEKFLRTMTVMIAMIHHISYLLQPFLPETAQKIAQVFGDDLSNKEIPDNYKFLVKKGGSLFPRLL